MRALTRQSRSNNFHPPPDWCFENCLLPHMSSSPEERFCSRTRVSILKGLADYCGKGAVRQGCHQIGATNTTRVPETTESKKEIVF